MKIIAHRGIFDKYIKENTKTSFIRALNDKNIVGIEVDVRVTKDNYFVISHDNNIARITGKFGNISDMNLDELRKINFGSKIAPSNILLLEDLLEIETNKIILLDLKFNNDIKDTYHFYDFINSYTSKTIYLASFDKKVIEVLKRLKTQFKLGLMVSIKTLVFNELTSYKNFDFISMWHEAINCEIIENILKNNKEVMVWTINKSNETKIRKKFNKYINTIYLIKDVK